MRRIGPYTLEEELGRGAAGVVYRARGSAGEGVAIKLLLPDASEQLRRRFARESRALLRMDHPGVVRALAADEAGGLPFLAMELVSGRSLQEHLEAEGPFSPAQAAEIARDVARALAHAHGLGILHRDVKPSNILLPADGRARLSDFGLVHDSGLEQSQLTRTGFALGSPGYWPPEQARGDRDSMDSRSDVYSLGATLFALLTGQAPFVGDSMVELLVAATSQPAPPPSSLVPVDRALDTIVLRCLAKDPEARFPSAEALAEALDDYLDYGGSAGAGASPGRAALVAGAVSGVCLAGLLLWGASQVLGDRAPRSVPPDASWVGEQKVPASPPEEPRGPASVEPAEAPPRRKKPDRGAAIARLNQGVVKQSRGDLSGAFADYTRAIELDPGFGEAYGNRGTALELMGDYEAALVDYETALRHRPDDARVWYLRGNALLFMERYEEAISDFNRAIDIQPDFADALGNRGSAHLNRRDWRAAIADYDQAIRYAPRSKQAWQNRGRAKEELKDYQGALADYGRAIALDPDYSKAVFNRAMVLLRLGRDVEAHRDMEHFVRLEPNAPEAARIRAVLEGHGPR